MKTPYLNRCKLMTLGVVVITVMVRLIYGAVETPAAEHHPTDLNLAPEQRALHAFGDRLSDLEKQCDNLNRKTLITNSEFNSARLVGDDLSRQVEQVQQTVRSVVSKLKSAGLWNTFDAALIDKVKDEKARSLLRDNGGPRQVLEDSQ